MTHADPSISFSRLAVAALALAVAVFAFAGIQPAGAGAKAPKCTIKGTKGPDKLAGTEKRDVICGFGGNDRIVGLGGNDTLIGGKGKDKVLGGTGDDRLVGGPGRDRLYGQPHDDILLGGAGNDYLNGGSGSNNLSDDNGQNRCLDGAADTVAGTCDNQAPVLVSATVTPTTVDTSAEARSIKVSFRVTDNLTGAHKHRMSVDLYQAETGQRLSGFPVLESGDPSDGTYTTSMKLPRYSAQGRWDLTIGAGDVAGNTAGYSGSRLERLGIPASIEQTGAGDSEKPKIRSVSLDRDTVNSSGSDQVIRARIRVTDDLTGIDTEGFVGVGFVAYHPGTEQFNYADVRRVSGTDTDGIYEAVMTVKRYSAQGDWQLRVGALDRAGNQTLHSYSELEQMGFPAYIHQTGLGDQQAPKLTELSITPGSIDTTSSAQSVSIRYRYTDNLSGINYGGNSVGLYVNGVQAPFQIDVVRTSGNARDGVFEGSVELPQGVTQGDWTIQIALFDDAGNGEFWGASELAAIGLDGSFTNGP